MRTTTLLGAGLLALSAGAAVFAAAAPAAGTEMRQETKKDADDAQKKSDKIVYWVLDASGKG